MLSGFWHREELKTGKEARKEAVNFPNRALSAEGTKADAEAVSN